MVNKKGKFRGALISLADSEVLRELENLTEKKFKLVKTIGSGIPLEFKIARNRVMYISIFNCGLSELPESIGNLKHLKVLYLNHNSLSSLPDSITHLKYLKHLSMYFNSFTSFPEIISSLRSLEYLNIAENPIEIIPMSIGNLKSLKSLNIAGTYLTKLPESVIHLKRNGLRIVKPRSMRITKNF